jgi:hypothetical protein
VLPDISCLKRENGKRSRYSVTEALKRADILLLCSF